MVAKKKTRVCIGFLGVKKDTNRRAPWRPTVALCGDPTLAVGRLELLHQRRYAKQARALAEEIRANSPSIEVRLHQISLGDPWDFQRVYASLFAFTQGYLFDPDKEEYLVHITTGTQVAQICMFMLTASHHLPGKLIQSLPAGAAAEGVTFNVIDLELEKYDQLSTLVRQERQRKELLLKDGIKTKNVAFNRMIAQIEQVSTASDYPILLTGPTGAGKSQLARRIYDLKKQHNPQLDKFVEINCATVRGDLAMSTLFGHEKGSFTGATAKRSGLLMEADGGVLFLDEIGTLGSDEQAMLLRALEVKSFYPLGSNQEVRSNFQLIAGTNSDLEAEIAAGQFRDDLLARISDWTFRLPALRERREDIEPNLRYELDKYAAESKQEVRFNRDAEQKYLAFAVSPAATWSRNFRDLNGSVRRMATMASGGRITLPVVEEEIGRLLASWRRGKQTGDAGEWILLDLLGEAQLSTIDLFDRFDLSGVIQVCLRSRTLSAAGRELFHVSRAKKSALNDADRLKKYLARFGLDWWQIKEHANQ
jgi:transcriptional regulatory protein RtcR